jgi:mannose-1-phosphate guanylyltransferase/mannose-6-phosphate isomerase
MAKPKVHPVILAGGASARLWPVSDRRHPKWDLRLFGPHSLLEQAWQRARALAPTGRCLVVAGAEHEARIRECLADLPEQNLLLEPEGRDTAGAVAYAAGVILGEDPDGVMLMMPCDHLIQPVEAFTRCVQSAVLAAAQEDALVTFGIVPRSPATCYGYIHRGTRLELEGSTGDAPTVSEVRAFKEKPSRETAAEYLRSGEYYWNAGIFAFYLPALRREFEAQLPGHAELAGALAQAEGRGGRAAALTRCFLPLKKISIDYGILEHARKVAVVAAAFEWDDIGSWSAVADHLPERDGQKVGPDVTLHAHESAGNLVLAPGRRVALIGVEGLAVVDSPQGLLICRLDKDQLVRQVSQQEPPRTGLPADGALLGVDPGTKRVGLAVTGALGIVHPLGFLAAAPRDQLLKKIASFAASRECVGIVVGLPLNMDGSEGPGAKAARELGAEIARVTKLPVDLHDERLTSFVAEKELAPLGLKKKHKGRTDAVAAALLLESYVAEHRKGSAGPKT